MRRVALQTVNLAQHRKRVKNADDVDEMGTVPEKRTGGKTGGELSPMDRAKGLWARNGKIGWTRLLLVHQFR